MSFFAYIAHLTIIIILYASVCHRSEFHRGRPSIDNSTTLTHSALATPFSTVTTSWDVPGPSGLHTHDTEYGGASSSSAGVVPGGAGSTTTWQVASASSISVPLEDIRPYIRKRKRRMSDAGVMAIPSCVLLGRTIALFIPTLFLQMASDKWKLSGHVINNMPVWSMYIHCTIITRFAGAHAQYIIIINEPRMRICAYMHAR